MAASNQTAEFIAGPTSDAITLETRYLCTNYERGENQIKLVILLAAN